MTLLLNYDSRTSSFNKFRIFYNKKIKEFWTTYQWVIIALLWVLTFVTGYIGYQKYLAIPAVKVNEGPDTPFNILYHILQLFVLQASFPADIDFNLQIARFLAPALVAIAGLQALFFVFNSQIDNVVLRFTRGHVIICGLGERGIAIAQSFFDQGERITVIDNDLDNINIKYLKRHGVRVVTGDATSMDLLKRLRAHHCSYLFATMNDDGENVEIAVNLFNLVHETRKVNVEKAQKDPTFVSKNKPVQCFINIMDPQIRNLLKQHAITTDQYDLFDLQFFNIYENSSNLLFRDPHLTSYLRLVKTDPVPMNIIIIGFGQMGQEIYLMTLKLFQFLGKDNLHYDIFDIIAEKRMSLFLKRYPFLDTLSSYTTTDVDINESEFLEKITSTLHTVPTTAETLILICIDADNIGVSAGLSIFPLLHNESIPIFVQTNSEEGLATILRSTNIFHFTNNVIIPFGIMKEVCSKDILINPSIDIIARRFHDHYIHHQQTLSSDFDSDANPFIKNWDLLSEARKDSYRQKVRTLEIILNGFNYEIVTKNGYDKPLSFTENECTLLGRIEHSRWLADRVLEGWRFEEGQKHSNQKTNPLLVAWDQLSSEDQQRNIDQMRDVPIILDSCNLQLKKV